jgi:hypothetical protein
MLDEHSFPTGGLTRGFHGRGILKKVLLWSVMVILKYSRQAVALASGKFSFS